MKNSGQLALAVLLAGSLTFPCSAIGQTAALAVDCTQDAGCLALKEQAAERSRSGDLVEALRLYKLAYEVRPDPRLLFNIARLLHKQGKTVEAVPYYQKFIAAPIQDEEQRQKAREYLEQIQAASMEPTLSEPTVNPPPLQQPAHATVPMPLQDPVGRRPRWRFIAGGAVIGAGLILTGFGISALLAQGMCVAAPVAPAQACYSVFTTNEVGGALVGTGVALSLGGVMLMAWPGKRPTSQGGT